MKLSYLEEKLKRFITPEETLDYIEDVLGETYEYELLGMFEFAHQDIIDLPYYNGLLSYVAMRDHTVGDMIYLILVADDEFFKNYIYHDSQAAESSLCDWFEKLARKYVPRSKCIDEYEWLLTTRLYDLQYEEYVDVFIPRQADGGINAIKFDVYYYNEILIKGCTYYDANMIMEACRGYDALQIFDVDLYHESPLKSYYTMRIQMKDRESIFKIDLPTNQMVNLSYYHVLKEPLLAFREVSS
ncbi:MAG: hypothetical protein ACRCST_00365 [Turicibacter sp.]